VGRPGKEFDHNRIDHTIARGALEEWTFENLTAEMHPMHVHVNPHQVTADGDGGKAAKRLA
jgi:FtsP/CotA-like multicopper oxidase with cupredoxin domain